MPTPSRLFSRRLLVLMLLLPVLGCGSSHRLGRYDFADAPVAVVAAVPPRPYVFSDAAVRVELDRPLRSLFRVGSALAKEAEVRAAQSRMDSALTRVDVPERIARQALRGSARVLHYRPVDHPRHADYLLDIRVKGYGLAADSWAAAVQFEVDADVVLLDNRTREVIWREHVKERAPVSGAVPGLGATFGNVFTAAALARLSVDEMTTALEELADFAAAEAVARLRDAYDDVR